MFHTVEDTAGRLRIHPKTVLRFIREGKLRATRVGRAYRILDADLAAFTQTTPAAPVPRTVRVTSIVDIPDASQSLHQYLSRSLQALVSSRASYVDPVRIDVTFDPATSQVKIIVAATPADTAALMSSLDALLQQGAT
ncbi:helix-turn-helix domain-containing protein [Burkholderia stabilis]|uniref:DNA binding domain, excisionase family,Helix-turn-helix domain n=1 Tax=Burkholderia stabilis TaxID=95485 RepID=A0AAJ5NCZ4_9BURK|nr:helix-turn-helix domain-containing protein [Burkholderia stabilis]VBB13073.1 DNA binding domain, excisionase family,Helix-turn-helix domain [Burkholderia stabilis]HDR9582818.1 helix-turn-helix domain-containing protein [Burkholderia stabilis]HDR9647788.1 helix-turn-helix domain-containing protein [Burkholderia stabilis]HDR9655262.1 helix-turn-helix domain-containing protein [Burkholderia stabilis]HDR9677232.1 helix-turn-helix domain-containing protein [Burkholderia stabilis]